VIRMKESKDIGLLVVVSGPKELASRSIELLSESGQLLSRKNLNINGIGGFPSLAGGRYWLGVPGRNPEALEVPRRELDVVW
jgi:hypothetical protein